MTVFGRKCKPRKYHSYITGYRAQSTYCPTSDVMTDLLTYSMKSPTD